MFSATESATLIPAVLPFSADPELEAISRPLFTQEQAIGQTQMIILTARKGFLREHHAAMVDMLEDMLRVPRFYSDPTNHAQTVQIVAKITKQPPARFDRWIFTKKDYYRSPDGLPTLKALQSNIDTQKELGFLKTAIDVN
jgi:NitT/TauT family transport system substrate-binding protein